MRITSLTIHDLRRYRDTTIELAPGLTVVRGPNEAGKTTVQRAHRARAHAQGHERRRRAGRRWSRGTAVPTPGRPSA